MEENQVEPVVEKPSVFGMIMNPRIQFERIRENPKIVAAILIVTLISLIGSILLASGMGDMVNDLPELEGLSEEELFVATIVSQITAVIGGLLSPVIMVLISTVIFIIIAKIVRSEVTFKQLFSMNSHIFLISAFSVLLNGIFYLVIAGGNPETLITSLNSIVGAEGVLGGVLNTIEVFTIWGLILTAMGLQIVAKFSKGLSWGIVIVFFIISIVFSMIGAALGSLGV